MKENTLSTKAAGAALRSFVERLQQIEAEKKDLAERAKEIKAEAKADGFDVKTITTIVNLSKKDKDTLSEENSLLEMYLNALGLGHLLN